MPFEVFEHTADLGLRIWASELPQLFAEAGRALFSTIVANLEEVRAVESLTLEVSGEDPTFLLFDWLNELLYLFESRHLLLRQFEVRLTQDGLTATIAGERLDRGRHVMDHEVKAITYHNLILEQIREGWRAEVIVDI